MKTWIVPILLFVFLSGLVPHFAPIQYHGVGSPFAQPLGSIVHRTYWLKGDICCWNGTSPGPPLNASNGDTLTIMLLSNDTEIHNWYIDFNGNGGNPDSNELPTRSLTTISKTSWLNFTFTPYLGEGNYTSGGETYAGIPHGGKFVYRCQYHIKMFGDFKFNAGPVASFTHSPNTPLARNQVSFDASSSWWSTNASTITNYTWDFGDTATNSTSSKTTTHTYAAPGNYSVTLNVTDNLSQRASTINIVRILNPPPIPFNYQIAITPDNVTLQAGRSAVVSMNLGLVSGTPENVTLSVLASPSDPLTQVSLQPTSGLPSFAVLLNITTKPSSLCYPDPCFLRRTITVTIIAVSETGVDHNATLTLNLTPTPTAPVPNYLPLAIYATIAAVAVATGTLLLKRSKRKS